MDTKDVINHDWKVGEKIYCVANQYSKFGINHFALSIPFKVIEMEVSNFDSGICRYSNKPEEIFFIAPHIDLISKEYNFNINDKDGITYADTVISAMYYPDENRYEDNLKQGRINKFFTKEEADKYLIEATKKFRKKVKDKIAFTKDKILDLEKEINTQKELLKNLEELEK